MRIQGLAFGLMLSAACVGLLSCGSSGERAESKPAESTPTASSTSPPREEKPSEAMLTGSYQAVSRTAMGITGNLTLATDHLSFELDQIYETALVAHRPASEDYAKGAGSFAEILLIPETATVEVRRISTEKVGLKAPNGGLCGPAKTTFVALASAPDFSGEAALRLAAFKSATPPGPDGDPADLCGTFNWLASRR